MKVINLDHLSANPLLPEVKEAMIAAIQADYAKSVQSAQSGEKALEMLEAARSSLMGLINCSHPKEIVFTSGGTESVNHAIKGVAMANAEKGKHIITSNIEHKSVIQSLKRMRSMGFKITSLEVDADGRVNPSDVADAITDDTILVSHHAQQQRNRNHPAY